MNRNICIDIDGTMSDPYFFIPYLNKLTGVNLKKEDYISNNWNDSYGPKYKDIYDRFDIDYQYIYDEVELQDGAKEVIDMLLKNGDNVYFVTARSKSLDDITKKWLEERGIDSSNLYSLSGNEGKVKMADKLCCDYFLEDDTQNIVNLFRAGYYVIVMDSYYNQGVEYELKKDYSIEEIEKRLTRVRDWYDIKKILI